MVVSVENIKKDIEALISGVVLDPSSAEYLDALTIDNAAVQHRPPIVVQPADSTDIGHLVSYFRKNGIRFTTKCGGHSANGYSLNTLNNQLLSI